MNYILIGIIAIGALITMLFIKFKTKQPSSKPLKKEEKVKLKEIKKLEKKDAILQAKHKKAHLEAIEAKKRTTESHEARKVSMSDLFTKVKK